ncbi:hypothetical protein DICVIV_12192 [Dictyocaulus viviparus]|uniref:ZP domain-containing protein n=1 Tax=Dictyocaulus viviparus TaxID=29172 RepID=A0A0D8XB43_DICVI|nr:hypothetical protein DICVIV_12192 [Dictyocaulus viviparus]
MSPIGTTELLNTLPTPSCTYTIHSENVDGPILMLGTVGEKIYHVWKCDSSVTGFLVHSCSVSDGLGEKIDLIDVDGCSVDPSIQPDVLYMDSNRAVVEVFGYKFSDATVLNYECVLRICRSITECENAIPPKCDRDKLENTIANDGIRTKRSIAQEGVSIPGVIEVATTLTMEEKMDTNTVTSQNNISALNLKQHKSKTTIIPQSICVPIHAILLATVLLTFAIASSLFVMFYIARYQIYVDRKSP